MIELHASFSGTLPTIIVVIIMISMMVTGVTTITITIIIITITITTTHTIVVDVVFIIYRSLEADDEQIIFESRHRLT